MVPEADPLLDEHHGAPPVVLAPRPSAEDLHGPLFKEAGEDKQHHEAHLASQVEDLLDIHDYVERFGASVLPAYRQGVADLELAEGIGATMARTLYDHLHPGE